jgi:hypothetical protein
LPPSKLPALLGYLRELTQEYLKGGPGSFDAFRDLTSQLLNITVMEPGAIVRLVASGAREGEMLLGGAPEPTDPIPLTDGRFLRLTISLFRERVEGGYRLKVRKSAFQYQEHRDDKASWIFRYDYLRNPPEREPGAHLQINGSLVRAVLPEDKPLGRVRFPTMRVSFEAIIRLLVEEFGVPCNESEDVWRPALDQTESVFFDIQHLPLRLQERRDPRAPKKKERQKKK